MKVLSLCILFLFGVACGQGKTRLKFFCHDFKSPNRYARLDRAILRLSSKVCIVRFVTNT